MATRIVGRQILIALSIPLVLSVACSKRSGLDRGDANDEVLRRPGSSQNEDQRAAETQAPDEADRAARQFAVPPPDRAAAESESAPADRSESARAAKPERSASSGSAAAEPSPIRRSRAPQSSPAPAREMSPRGDSAYSARDRSYESYRPEKKERPGLGTSFGETRRSLVSTVSFQREQPSTPTSTQRIFYNNAAGIMAQTGERSISSLGPNITDLGRGFVTVEIVDPEGIPLPGLAYNGRSYVVGRDGDRYSIRVQNHERYRVEVVASVDGLDVIDGTSATYQKRGYVVEPYATLLIEGFRRSTNAVAAFRFGSVSNSYAAKTGSDRHVGVVGVAVFGERGYGVDEYSDSELRRRETADPFPGQFAKPPRPRVDYRAY